MYRVLKGLIVVCAFAYVCGVLIPASLPHYFSSHNIPFTYNTSPFYGISHPRWFVLAGISISLFCVYIYKKISPQGAIVLTAGIISNVTEFITYNQVFDYIPFGIAYGNIADICIYTSVMYILHTQFTQK